MASDVEHIFTYLLAFHRSLEKRLFRPFAHFLKLGCLELSSALLVRGVGSHSPQQVGLSQLPCLGKRGRSCSSLLCFPNRFSVWEGLGATLSHGYELTPLPMQSKGIFHAWYWFCSGDDQLCLLTSQLKCC